MEKPAVNRKEDGSNGPAAPLIALPGSQMRPRIGKEGDSLQYQRVRLVYSNLPFSIVISAMLALILIGVQASVITSGRLFAWSALLGLVLLGRAVLFLAWRRYAGAVNQTDIRRWLFWFRVGAIVTGIVWGIGGVLLTPSGEVGDKIFVSFVLAGLSAGAATTLAVDRISVAGFLSFVLVPQAIFHVTEGDAVSLSMGAMTALFLIFLLSSARQLRLQVEENFLLREKATENESRMRQILESSPIATCITDADSNEVVFVNSRYISLIDSTPEQVIGIVSSRYYANPGMIAEIMERLGKGEHISNELVELRSRRGRVWTKWVLASYFPVKYQDKPAVLGWFYDITDRKLTQDQIEHMAYHDTLTGLPNRSLFIDHLKKAITRAERNKELLALMFVDLDKFKSVNDQYGHHIGDLLLKYVADRIIGTLRRSDSAARFGGDEFIILLLSVKKEKNALIVAEKIRHVLGQPFEIAGLTLQISASIGVTLYPSHADTEYELMKRADIAMYYAKAEGRNCVKVYHKTMLEQSS